MGTIRFYTVRDLDRPPLVDRLSRARRDTIRVIGHVLPFRANSYVVDELIDWNAVPDDPIFRLTFPQAGMLAAQDRARVAAALGRGYPAEVRSAVEEIRRRLNPHPAGQLSHNVPTLE